MQLRKRSLHLDIIGIMFVMFKKNVPISALGIRGLNSQFSKTKSILDVNK